MSAVELPPRPVLLDLSDLPRHGRAVGRARSISRPVAAVALLAIMAAGTALRLHHLGAQSLWLDEGLSVWGAHQSVPTILDWLTHSSVHPPLYFLYLHWWAQLGGYGVSWLRLASVIPGVLTIPVVYALGRRLHGRGAGLIAALLLAASPFAVVYAQDVRMYTLFGLAATSASLCLVWGLQTGRRVAWVLYAIAGLATVYTHNVGGAIIFAHAVIVLTAWLGENRGGRYGAMAVAVTAVGWVPWLIRIPGQSSGKGGSLSWIGNPRPQQLGDLVRTYTSAMLPPRVRLPIGTLELGGLRALLVPLALGLAGAGLVALRRRRGAFLVGLVLLAGPFVLALDAGLKQPVLLDRTLIPLAILLLVMMGVGLASLLRHRWLGVAAATVLVGLLCLNAASFASWWNLSDGRDVNERWDWAAAYIAARQRPGDVIALNSGSIELPFNYYYKRIEPHRLKRDGVPCQWMRECPGLPDLAASQAWAAHKLTRYRRIWLVQRWYGNADWNMAQVVGPQAVKQLRLIYVGNPQGVHIYLFRNEGGRLADWAAEARRHPNPPWRGRT